MKKALFLAVFSVFCLVFLVSVAEAQIIPQADYRNRQLNWLCGGLLYTTHQDPYNKPWVPPPACVRDSNPYRHYGSNQRPPRQHGNGNSGLDIFIGGVLDGIFNRGYGYPQPQPQSQPQVIIRERVVVEREVPVERERGRAVERDSESRRTELPTAFIDRAASDLLQLELAQALQRKYMLVNRPSEARFLFKVAEEGSVKAKSGGGKIYVVHLIREDSSTGARTVSDGSHEYRDSGWAYREAVQAAAITATANL